MKYIKYIILFLILSFVTAVYVSLHTSINFPEFSKPTTVNLKDKRILELDSIAVVATTQYRANKFKTFMQGKHYRQAWETPVKAPILDLNLALNGLTPIKKGGGKQTKSLKLITKDSFLFSLRSINKFPEPLVPKTAKFLGLSNIVVDGISAQHPYATLVVSELSNQVGLLNTKPKLYFVPKQFRLENYNDEFGDKLYFLEYETENKNFTPYKNVVKIVETDDLIELKQNKTHALKIDKAFFIKNRLFDFIIGDWDRHAKQWGWVLIEENNQLIAKALPADRDNAFFYVDGVIPSIISNRFLVNDLQSFKKTIDYLPALVEPVDRYFLLQTDERVFIEQAEALKQQLTNKSIEDAFKVWPEKIREIDATILIERIKSRRDLILSYAKAFKKSIDEKGFINEPLKGCEDIKLSDKLKKCFNCN